MEPITSATVPDTSTNQRRKKRYLIFNSQDLEDLYWKNVKLCNIRKTVLSNEIEEDMDVTRMTDDVLGEELHCRTCMTSFGSKEDYRIHYRDDWHRYNLKSKLKDRPPVSQDDFFAMEDDISSISGSESEDEKSEEIIRSVGSPKVFFKNNHGQEMAIYRCLLHPKKKEVPTNEELIGLISQLPTHDLWTIIMLGGGHFAAGIYRGAELVAHKTFHSYTVRAKQGGSQSSRDNKSGGGSHPKSAGASLRRYNEAAFAEHVQSTFVTWVELIKKSHLILYRAASSNQTIMFGGKNPFFDRADPRLRSIPIQTRRATLKEIQRVWLCLATIQLIEEEPKPTKEEVALKQLSLEDDLALLSTPETSDEELRVLEEQRWRRTQKKLQAKINSNIADQSFPIDPEADLFPGEKEIMESIAKAVKQCNLRKVEQEIERLVEVLATYRDEYHLDLLDVLGQRLGEDCSTLLHQAAQSKKGATIVWKLMELGCDPGTVDTLGRVPYMVAEKETRASFRRFMAAYPDRFDYAKALIPSPLTEEMEKQRLEKQAEKRKQQKQRLKEKKIIEKANLEEEKARLDEEKRVREEARKVEEEKSRFLALSDREKRALAAERRLLTNITSAGAAAPVLVRCFLCGADMSGKVPFEYNTNKFCSPPCLQKHRKMKTTK